MSKQSVIDKLNKAIRMIALSKRSYLFLFLLKKEKVVNLVDIDNSSENNNIFSRLNRVINHFKINLFTNCARYSTYKRCILSTVRFQISEFKSFKMEIDLNEYTQCNYYFGNISIYLLQLIKKLGNSDETFIDIGTNVGFYSLAASKYFSSVISFEPQPNCISSIRRHILVNDIKCINIVEKGLSDFVGTFDLNLDPLNQGGASLAKPGGHHKKNEEDVIATNKKSGESITIDVTTLDQYFEDNFLYESVNLKFVKIDVEGHEESVLKGAIKVIDKYKPILFIEVDSTFRIINMLSILPFGYIAYDLASRTKIDKNSPSFGEFVDIVFFHDSDRSVNSFV
jgi:FkbM family methyltransferase